MATKKAIHRIRTKKTAKRASPTGKKSKATSDFYGQPILKGALHKAMGIPPNRKIPTSKEKAALARLKKKKNKTAADIKKERRLVFALNAKKWK